ncbi:MAG: MFS transporter [Lysobacteraceae bacterium]
MSAAQRPDWLAVHPPAVAPVRRREVLAWALFDFANSGYTTVVITAVFNAFFVAVIAADAAWATFAWTLALSVSYAVNALAGPLVGAWADLRARKRAALMATTLVCALGTAALSLCGPGDVALALGILIVSNIAFGLGENLIAAFLPELAHPDAMGKVSGWGWGLGYLGGLLVLALCLAWITASDAPAARSVPPTLLITALAFALTALPTFVLLRERARPQTVSAAGLWHDVIARVRSALAGSHALRDLRRLLVCIVCFQAGVQTVIAIAAIFTTQALGFSAQESIALILLVNLTAAVGAFGFGHLQDRLGHRRTLAFTLVGWLLAIAVFWFAETRPLVWFAANLAGLCLGASQSAGRALVGYLCPREREAEIFGLWGLAVKLASILGPLSYGTVNWLSGGDHHMALLTTAVAFVAGLVLLFRVDVARGRAAALAAG